MDFTTTVVPSEGKELYKVAHNRLIPWERLHPRPTNCTVGHTEAVFIRTDSNCKGFIKPVSEYVVWDATAYQIHRRT
jgi:hypothetical protein